MQVAQSFQYLEYYATCILVEFSVIVTSLFLYFLYFLVDVRLKVSAGDEVLNEIPMCMSSIILIQGYNPQRMLGEENSLKTDDVGLRSILVMALEDARELYMAQALDYVNLAAKALSTRVFTRASSNMGRFTLEMMAHHVI